MLHNAAVQILGSCRCACHHLTRHPLRVAACWCDPGARHVWLTDTQRAELTDRLAHTGVQLDPPRIGHNDATAILGRCPSPHHDGAGPATCTTGTDPHLRPALDREQSRDLQRRLVTGRARPEEYLRHAPWMIPGTQGPGSAGPTGRPTA